MRAPRWPNSSWLLGLALVLAATACSSAAPAAPPAAKPTAAAPAAPAPAAAPTTAPAAQPAATAPAAQPTAAAAAAQPAKVAAVSEVRIGEALSLTGGTAPYGQQYLWSHQTVEDIVNNDYPNLDVPLGPGKGFPNLGGAPLKLVVRDDQSKGDLARTALQQLITIDKIHWIAGDATSAIVAETQPVAESAGIPLSCAACSSPSLTEKGFKWFWRTGPTDALMVGNIFQFLKEWPQNGGPSDLKTIALLGCDALFCSDSRKIALDEVQKAGLQLGVDLTTKQGSPTLASEVQRLKAANPDVLLLTEYTPDTIVFQADAKRLGFNPKLIVTNNGHYSDEAWLQAQKKTNGGVGWMGRDPTSVDLASKNPRFNAINDIYKKYSNGIKMGEVAMREVQGLLWVVETINRAGSVDPAALQKAANATNIGPEKLIISYQGIKFDDKGQNQLGTGVISQIGWDGEKHTIWPWSVAKGSGYQVVYPNPSFDDRDSKPKPAS